MEIKNETSNENTENDNIEVPKADELTVLKARADMIGVSYHPNIGVDKLREKIAAKLADKPDPDSVELAKPAAKEADAEETEGQMRMRLKNSANELVRINVTCMNPAKREWEGEIFTTGNSIVGTFKKFVPFNTSEGYHVPRIILEMLKNRECQLFRNEKAKNGVTVRKGYLIKEFAIEVLPPLTKEELRELARRQAMAAGQSA